MACGFAREYIGRFGFDPSILPANLSLALGSASVPPLSMARGYAVFANGGYLVNPYFIETHRRAGRRARCLSAPPRRVCPDCDEAAAGQRSRPPADDAQSEPAYRPLVMMRTSSPLTNCSVSSIYTAPPLAPRVISEQNAYLVRSMMMDVIRRGTGKKAMELGRNDLAGKTGTTNDQRDAWFSGYNSRW